MNLQEFLSGASATPPSAPATPSVGWPVEASPPTPATIPGVFWAYQIIKEFHAVVEGGGLTVDSSDLTQLLKAIQRLTSIACLAKKTSAQTISNSLSTIITLSAAEYDEDGSIWSAGNPSRLTVPTGYTKARLAASIGWAINSTGQRVTAITKNGSSYVGIPHLTTPANTIAGQATYVPICSPWLDVSGGDYFEMTGVQTSGGNLDCATNTDQQEKTWFFMEVKR